MGCWTYLPVGGLAALTEAVLYVVEVGYFTVVLDLASATTVWLAVSQVIGGLGGGNEIVGGIWTWLVSVIALRTGALYHVLNAVGAGIFLVRAGRRETASTSQ